MSDLSEETIVTAEIAGHEVPGQIVEPAETTAAYGEGPEQYYRISVPGAGTWRVPESDITAPT